MTKIILLAILLGVAGYVYGLNWKCDYSNTSPDGRYYFCQNKLTKAIQKREFVVIHTDGCGPTSYERRAGVIYFNSYHSEWCGNSSKRQGGVNYAFE